MTSLQQFITMGGYAFYVWTAYGAAAGLLIINALTAILRNKKVKRRLQQQMMQAKR